MPPPGPTRDPLDERLQARDPSVRYAALDDLREKASPRVMARAAAPLLADPDPGLRERAARLLATLSAPERAAQEVAPYITHSDITARNLAGEVLVDLGPPAIDALAPFLRHDDPDVRKFAIDLLAQLPANALADDIAAALDDADANVRLAAVDALGALQATAYADALRDLYDREPLARPDIIQAMGAFGEDADLDVLERGLKDNHPVVQLASAEALASHDAPEVIDLLLDQLDRVNPMARPIVLHSIIELCTHYPQYRDALPDTLKGYLLDMLADDDCAFRCAAARGLRWFPDDGLYEAMLGHAGRDEELDMELFTTLLSHPTPFRPLHRAATSGPMPPSMAATFTVGLMARGALSDHDYDRAGTLLEHHFDALSVDDKITTVGLCIQRDRPELHGVMAAARRDPAPQVQALAADAHFSSSAPASSYDERTL
ncbi:MAG: HEAT repeat domain-containing protein [Bacteroidetes bacterium]|nr:HEAT repeat domain-containing protein [Bacteroidota bacterium]